MKESIAVNNKLESSIALMSGEQNAEICLNLLKKCLAISGTKIISENLEMNTSSGSCLTEITFLSCVDMENLIIVANEIAEDSIDTINDFTEVMLPFNYKDDVCTKINRPIIKYSSTNTLADVVVSEIEKENEKTKIKMFTDEKEIEMIVNSNIVLPLECLVALSYAMVKTGIKMKDIIKCVAEL